MPRPSGRDLPQRRNARAFRVRRARRRRRREFHNPPARPFPPSRRNIDINNPANFQWNNGLVQCRTRRHITKTRAPIWT